MRGVAICLTLALAAAAPASAQDIENGEKVFKKCAACHQVGPDAAARVGPPLNGVVGRAAGTVEGFKYSDALLASGITWDEATLANYLKDPKEVIPDGKMSFAGLKKDEEVTDVIAYLSGFTAEGEEGDDDGD